MRIGAPASSDNENKRTLREWRFTDLQSSSPRLSEYCSLFLDTLARSGTLGMSIRHMPVEVCEFNSYSFRHDALSQAPGSQHRPFCQFSPAVLILSQHQRLPPSTEPLHGMLRCHVLQQGMPEKRLARTQVSATVLLARSHD